MPGDLKQLCMDILCKVDVPEADADIIAELMVDTDLRGVHSHGSQTLGGYARAYKTGRFNPKAEIRIIKDTSVFTMVDGDGGVGHLATHKASQITLAKARAGGLSMAVCRNHGHFGSAGKYVRMAVRQGFIGFCVSGLAARKPPEPDTSAWAHYPLDNCPLSIGFPSESGYPVILDMSSSVIDEWDVESERFKSIFGQMPAAVFRSFGLRAATDFLSAGLGGMMLSGFREGERACSGAYYGAFLWFLDPSVFVDPEAFRHEIDRTTELIGSLKPLPGYDFSYLPGGLEWEREREYAQIGIPIGEWHQATMEGLADEFGVSVPWSRG
jgi:LDH2 family malate/lactate/ureidoglycolate dehydrogenase